MPADCLPTRPSNTWPGLIIPSLTRSAKGPDGNPVKRAAADVVKHSKFVLLYFSAVRNLRVAVA